VLKTNYTGYQNEYTLTDYSGDTVIHRFGLVNDSIYNDTVHLEPGCYTLYLTDTEQNGLHFWYHASQGSGYMRIKGDTLGIIHKSFNPDFGKDIYYEFTVGYYLSEDDIPLKENFKLRLMPNPAADFCILEFSLPMHQKTEIRLLNMLGETVKQESLVVTNETERFVLDLENITKGFYVVSVTAGGKTNSRKLVVNR
jgi:hypothetical protein